jgi:hypothetical protein
MRKGVVGGRNGEGPRSLSPMGMVGCACVEIKGIIKAEVGREGIFSGVWTSIYRFLAGLERIAEKSLAEGRGGKIRLVLWFWNIRFMIQMKSSSSGLPLFSQMERCVVYSPRQTRNLQSLVIQLPRQGNIQPF